MSGSGAESGYAVPLTREHCLHRVADATYGRIIYTQGALPAVLPVTFTLDGDQIAFDVDPTTSLAQAFRHAVLAFHVDDVDLLNGIAWSVTVTGHARLFSGTPADDLLHLLLAAELVVGWRTAVRPLNH